MTAAAMTAGNGIFFSPFTLLNLPGRSLHPVFGSGAILGEEKNRYISR
jgi:hypothetical protein